MLPNYLFKGVGSYSPHPLFIYYVMGQIKNKYTHTRISNNQMFRIDKNNPITIEDIWAMEDFFTKIGYDITKSIHQQFCKKYNLDCEKKGE